MRNFLFISVLLFFSSTVKAIPAYRGAVTVGQPDGTAITIYLHGDEFRHECVTTDGYLLLQDMHGAYRYAVLDGNKRLTCRNSPIAHNPKEREAKELKFVEKLPLLKEMKAAGYFNAVSKTKRSQTGAGARQGAMSRFQIGTYPTIGKGNCLVLLVQFNDIKFSFGKDYHSRMLNEEGFCDNGATGSARDYYLAQSMGQFDPSFDIVGPITLTRSESYYGQDDYMLGKDVNVGSMISEACQDAKDKYNVDFSKYDGDGDGRADMVYVIYAGYGQHAGGGDNTIWPHKYQLSSLGINKKIDGKTIDTYACSSELFGNTGAVSSGIGTLCHEFGHVLGLADHYNTNDATDYQLGRYDIMDYGGYNNNGNTPPAYNAFERMTLGWMKPVELNSIADGLKLGHIAETNEAYMITTSDTDEFYLLENRQQTGWDSHIKGCGMMVTHVDFDADTWVSNKVNDDTAHPRFYMVEADNEKGYDEILCKISETHDLFPAKGNDSFTDTSTPAAHPYTGEILDKWITDIKNENGIVSFNYMSNHLHTPDGLAAEALGAESFRAVWNNVSRADEYTLNLYKLDYRSAQRYAVTEGFSLMKDGTVETPGTADVASQLDKYTTVKGFTGTNVYQAGGWCQIGTDKQGGSLTAPPMNMKRYGGEYAVALTVKSMTGKQPVLSVTSNGQTGKTRINNVARTYLFQFKGGISKTDITIATNIERALIDTLVVVRGNGAEVFPQAKKIDISGEPSLTEGDVEDNDFIHVDTTTVTGVRELSYTFDGLRPDSYYSFSVKAMGDGCSSEYSEEYVLKTTDGTSAVADDVTECPNAKTQLFTVDGKAVNAPASPGIYIRRTGNTVKKVIIK